jgi:hypothetical protein
MLIVNKNCFVFTALLCFSNSGYKLGIRFSWEKQLVHSQVAHDTS